MNMHKMIKSVAVALLMTTAGGAVLTNGTDAFAKTTHSSARSKNVKVLSTSKVKKANYYAKNTSGWAYSPTKYYRYFQLKEHAKDTFTVDKKMYINDKGVKELYFHVTDNSNKKVTGWVWHQYLAKGTVKHTSVVTGSATTKEAFNSGKFNSAVLSTINAKRSAKGIWSIKNNGDMSTIAKIRAQQLTSYFGKQDGKSVFRSTIADKYGYWTPQTEIIGKTNFTGNNIQTARNAVTAASKQYESTFMNRSNDVSVMGVGSYKVGNTVYSVMETTPDF